MSEIKELREYFVEIMQLHYIQAGLSWDREVNMMSYKSVEGRSNQLALIEKLLHQRITSEKVGRLLNDAEKLTDLDEIDVAMVREMRRQYDLETKLPEELVVEITKTATLAQQTWQRARKENNFKLFEPYLEKPLHS